jgi:hypothetical protein
VLQMSQRSNSDKENHVVGIDAGAGSLVALGCNKRFMLGSPRELQ